ncbi:MAG: hypothetical protein CVV41_22220 [Candidatus Riflebacteria bacterium HGW-Riflebacteria-1]|nr:MAG: hypothetical protein CVV41_22220 [Candidatus Riflebacteria bacterium HGW-Riflebacteria-1]
MKETIPYTMILMTVIVHIVKNRAMPDLRFFIFLINQLPYEDLNTIIIPTYTIKRKVKKVLNEQNLSLADWSVSIVS